jgi:N-acetylmuramoyl-L-alanine amidase
VQAPPYDVARVMNRIGKLVTRPGRPVARVILPVVILGGATLVGACQSSTSGASAPLTATTAGHADTTSTTRAPVSRANMLTTSTTVTVTSTVPSLPLTGFKIALDPGHNGGPVPPGMVDIGNGIRHPCDSTGTANRDGLTESALVLDVALRVRAKLESLGATVLMSRTTNTGSGPCIDERVYEANRAGVDLGLSIHADGVTGVAAATGFHIAVPMLIPGQSQRVVDESLRFAIALRSAYAAATGLPVSNYAGHDGIFPRSDLANTNLTNHTRVLFELGVLNNAVPGGHDDLAVLSTERGKENMARGLVNGIVAYLRSVSRTG